MIKEFEFTSPRVKKFELGGHFYNGNDVDKALARLGLMGTIKTRNDNNLSIDGVYIISTIAYENAEHAKAVQILNEFVNNRIMEEQYGDNSIMIFIICDYTNMVLRDIHKAGFTRIMDSIYSDFVIYMGITPFTDFLYDITDRDENPVNKKNDKPMYS